ATGEAEQHLALADLRAHPLDRVLDDVAGAPQRIRAADLAHEALEEPRALCGVGDLGMELHAVEVASFVAHGGERYAGGRRADPEARRQCIDPIAVTHPHIEHRTAGRAAAVREIVEKSRGAGHGYFGVAEFTLAGGSDAPAKLLRHGLHAVADAEHRHAEREHRRRCPGWVGSGHRFRAAGEDDAARAEGAHRRLTHVPRMYLAVHPELAHPPGDQLRVLRAEVEDQDALRVDVRVRGCIGGGGTGSWNARHGSNFRTPGSWAPPW